MTVPSGSATGTDEPWSLMVTLGLRPVFGSTPVGAPWRQLVARTPQPSFRSSRIRKVHFGVRFEFRATSDESLEAKCARLTTKMVPPGPIAGPELKPGRCEPQGAVGTGTVAGYGPGMFPAKNVNGHWSPAAGAPLTMLWYCTMVGAAPGGIRTSQPCASPDVGRSGSSSTTL